MLGSLLLALVLVLGSEARAQAPACGSLQGAKRELAMSLLREQHPYDCCDDTIAACLAKKPVCRLARRLADDVCRRVAAGQDKAAVERALTRRAASMMRTGKPVPIDLGGASFAGDPGAKVTVVAYACERCQLCSQFVPALHRLVTAGPLKGKARLALKLFPLKSHAHSNEAALATLAAGTLGRLWPYALHLYANFDTFDANRLADYAVAVGADRAAFQTAFADPALRERLVESKREGLRNKVDATPTIFIGGFRYSADLTPEALADVLEEEHERATGSTHE
jgi:protein-disulfide isomerase